MVRSGLTLRLLGLLAASILPAMAALIYMQVGLRAERSERVNDSALRQAGLLTAQVGTVVDGARQMLLAVAHAPISQSLSPDCGAQLRSLAGELKIYTMIAVVDRSQRVICSAGVAVPDLRDQLADALNSGRFMVGKFAPMPAMLPIFQPFKTTSGQTAVVIAGIDLRWMRDALGRFRNSSINSLTLADRAGTILVRLPEPDKWVGQKITSAARGLLQATEAGVRTIKGLDGTTRRVGFVPPAMTNGLYVAYGLYVPSVMAPIDRAAQRGYLLVAAGAGLAWLLMVLITHRLVHRPTEALLGAAQRWSQADFAARAEVCSRPGSEFARLAAAFNEMAETLDVRRTQLRQLNASLEVRVIERTRALSETNDRLLVEIAERERADAVLRQSQKLQAVGQLAGGMAHEFNNLLAIITGALDLLRLRLGEGHALQKYTSAAIEAAQRGGRLTSQMLAFARRRRLLPVAVDLNSVIAEVRELIQGTLGRGITLIVHSEPELWHALADRHEIEAALLNLVFNARDALHCGGTLRITTRNTVWDRPGVGEEDYVELIVADDGIGMSDTELAHAVDPFFTTKAPGQGAGLGLSQVHGIAEQLGGDLHIVSSQASGTSVSLKLPRAVTAIATPVESFCPPRVDRTLLLVDDDTQVRTVSADMLGELGFEVTTAASGEEAVLLLRDRQHAVLVADYAMPGMSGVTLIRQAQQDNPALITLLITGYMDFDEAAVSDLLAPRQVLRKPFTLRQLSKRIAELSHEAV